MRPPSIRARLTLWYFAVQAVTFAAFGIGIFFAVRGSVHAAIDEDLRQRLQGIRRFMERVGPIFSQEDLTYELREHSGLRPGGDLLQVSDAQGNWIFRSASIRDYAIPRPGEDLAAPRYETQVVRGIPLRIVSATFGVPGKYLHRSVGSTAGPSIRRPPASSMAARFIDPGRARSCKPRRILDEPEGARACRCNHQHRTIYQ